MSPSFLQHVSLFSLVAVIVSATPVFGAVAYLISPTDQALALMRPLSLASISASVSSVLLGFVNVFEAIERTAASGTVDLHRATGMLAEAMILGFIGCACMTAAWLCVAVAIRRTG